MKHLLYLLLLSPCFLSAQYAEVPDSDVADHAAIIANTITADDLSEYLHVLASDAFEGRETGTPGNTKAANYIADRMKEFGIPPVPSLGGYFQHVVFSQVNLSEKEFDVNGIECSFLKDYVLEPQSMTTSEIVVHTDDILFLGYGIDDPAYSDYHRKRVEGKTILIYNGEPMDENGNSWITGNAGRSEWSRNLDLKMQAAARHGVAAVLIVEGDFRKMAGMQRRYILGGHVMMGVPPDNDDLITPIHLSTTLAETLMGKKSGKVIGTRDKISRKGHNKSVRIKADVDITLKRNIDSTPGVNVLGYIEGIDSTLKDELVIITAHYDHIGRRGDEIFNGADDNASGTSGVLELAEAFEQAKKLNFGPRRSVLCMLVTGEEKGLLGSQYYSEHPVFPLENTVVDINMDMIGRQDAKHNSPDYIYVIGSNRLSSELHKINEEVNAHYTHLDLDYTYNDPADPNRFYYRSDHYNFAKNGIPSIFYFSGVHADYHRPTDTVDKIDFPRAAHVAKLAFYTAWELANRDERIKVDVPQGKS